MTDPRSFGAWLRRERERRSITLRAIADRTKIGAGRLEALERGDISHWPGGIYRRAFVRAYAGAIGLDADLVVANFERVFPDPAAPGPIAPAPASAVAQPEMRLALVTPSIAGVTTSALKTAGRDVACILAAALLGLALRGVVGFWCAGAIAALAFHLSRLFGLAERAIWRTSVERARRLTADVTAALAASTAALAGRRRAARS